MHKGANLNMLSSEGSQLIHCMSHNILMKPPSHGLCGLYTYVSKKLC